jgi:hypothetical protein
MLDGITQQFFFFFILCLVLKYPLSILDLSLGFYYPRDCLPHLYQGVDVLDELPQGPATMIGRWKIMKSIRKSKNLLFYFTPRHLSKCTSE